MVRPLPDRILWPEGPLRLVFSLVAVCSAVALYLSVPAFATSPTLFGVAAVILFGIEVWAFERWTRQLAHASETRETVRGGDALQEGIQWLRLGVQESYSTHQDLARFKSELTGEIGKLSVGIAQLAALVSDAAQSTRTELSDIAKSTGRVSPDALLAQVSELKSLLDGLVQSSKDRTVREEELSAEIAGLKHSLEVIIQQTESTIVQPSSAIEPRRIRIPTVNPSVAGRLTEREKQVVALVAQGLTNRQMARQLQLSEHVVKAVISVLMTKLRVSTRSEIVAKAVSSPPSLWP